MSDHRLHASETDRTGGEWSVVLVEHDAHALDFGGVADGGARSVRLDEGDRLRVHPGVEVGAAQRVLLTSRVRGGDPFASAVRGAADPTDDGVDLILVADRIRQTLEDQDTGPFAHDEPVRVRVERARTVGREGSDLGELHVGRGPHRTVHSAGDDHVELVGTQTVDRGLERGERRSTGGIADVVGPPQVEGLRDASRDDVRELPGHRIFGHLHDLVLDALRDGVQELLDLVVAQAAHRRFEEGDAQRCVDLRILDPEVGLISEITAERVAENHGRSITVEVTVEVPRVLQRLPHGFETEELGRVDFLDDGRRQTERLSVEFEPRHPATDLAVRLVRRGGIGVPVERGVPAIRRHVRDAVDAVDDVVPEGVRREGAGHFRADADDGDGRLAVEDIG